MYLYLNRPRGKETKCKSLIFGIWQDALVGFLRKWVPFVGRTALPSYIPADSFAKAVLQLVRDDNQRRMLHDLDNAIMQLNTDAPGTKASLRLLGLYHNLLRMWSDT